MIQCRFIRWKCQRHMDENTPSLPSSLTNHLRQCPSCRDFYARLRQADEQLRQKTPDMLSPAQHKRMEHAVLNRLQQLDRPQSRRIYPAAWRQYVKTAAIAAAAVIAVMVINARLSAPDITELPTLAVDSDLFRRQFTTMTALAEEPMQAEMQTLTRNARQMITFILDRTPRPDL